MSTLPEQIVHEVWYSKITPPRSYRQILNDIKQAAPPGADGPVKDLLLRLEEVVSTPQAI